MPKSFAFWRNVSIWMRLVSVGDRLVDVDGRGVVVLGGDRQIGAPHGPASQAQAFEGLRAGHLVHEVQVDVDEVGRPVGALDHNVVVPHLFRQRPAHGYTLPSRVVPGGAPPSRHSTLHGCARLSET